ncbi:MAG: glycosyltransferase [Acidobacteria bacterium]|nr:glycosyltransferase [Acidobacteriota bacterium]
MQAQNATTRRLKVCHICAASEGAAWLAEQLQELRDRHGHEVTALVVDDECELAKRLKDAGVRRIAVPFVYRSFKDLVKLPATIYRMARVLKRERFDVVQTHLFSSMFVGRIAAWLADVPVRLAMVASPFHLEAPITRYIDGATVWMETGIIASCERTVRLYEDMFFRPKQLSLIYYGADQRKFDPDQIEPAGIREEYGWEADTPIVVLVAYFYPELTKSRWIPKVAWGRGIKGHENFVEAAALLSKDVPGVKFLLVGRPFGEYGGEEYFQKIVQLVKDRQLGDTVIFTGHRTDVNEILLDSNVAVQIPIIENLGGSIEALMMRRPFIATNVGGMPDAVRDGETGLLIEPDDAGALATAIRSMLEDPDRARKMAEQGRRLALERFSLERTVDDLHNLYQVQHARHPKGYRPLVTAGRHILSIPVYAYLGYRFIFLDYVIRIYVPVYAARVRGLWYAVLCKSYIARGNMRIAYYALRGRVYAAYCRLRGSLSSTRYKLIALRSRVFGLFSRGISFGGTWFRSAAHRSRRIDSE